MNAYTSTLATLLLVGAATTANAQSEGGGDPFPFRGEVQLASGAPFTNDTAQTVYPQSSGSTTRRSSLADLSPTFGSECGLETSGALPPHASEGPVAFAQSRRLERAAVRVREAGLRRVGG